MLRALRTVGACCLCVLAFPRFAAAEWHISPMIGVTFAGNTSLQDLDNATGKVHPAFGGAVALLGNGLFGAEGVVIMTPGFFQSGDGGIIEKSRALAVMGNVVLTAPRRLTEYNLRPFVSGGFGLLRATQMDKVGVLPVESNLVGFNIGGGAVGFFSARTGVRFDLRYYSSIHGSEQGPVSIGEVNLRYMTASVGIVFRR